MNKKKNVCILSLILIISFLVGGCDLTTLSDRLEGRNHSEEEIDFDDFAESFAISSFSLSEISLHQFITDREAYEAIEAKSYWGEINDESIQSRYDDLEQTYNQLLQFDYDELSEEQQKTYEVFRVYLEGELSVRDYYLLDEIFAPQSGTHVMIPFYLSIYLIENKEDLERYHLLVKDIERFLSDCADYQVKRSEAGIFMREDYARLVIEEIHETIDNADLYFRADFEALIQEAQWLTQEEKNIYIVRNNQYIDDYVIPAYLDLAETLESLKHTGMDGRGLHRFEGGKEYYARLLQKTVGTQQSVDEIFDTLTDQINKWSTELRDSQDIASGLIIDTTFYPYSTPEEIVDRNLEMMDGRFPEVEDLENNYFISDYIPRFMEGVIGGLYVFSSIEISDVNRIYYSRWYHTEQNMYKIISHEAIPGHLYQTMYFLTSDVPNIELRYFIMAEGEGLSTYEGWTTYIEGVSYEMAGLPEAEVRYLVLESHIFDAAISAIDIGIHYYAWDDNDVESFLRRKGLDYWIYISEHLYQIIDTNPTMYLPYALGYIDLTEMLYRAQEELGEDFSEYEFHTFYLDHSSLTMDIIKDAFEVWIEEQKEISLEKADIAA